LHKGPQPIDLRPLEAKILQQYLIQLLGMLGSLPQPAQDRILLDPFDPRDGADPIPFG
jgi:hypothetical protein